MMNIVKKSNRIDDTDELYITGINNYYIYNSENENNINIKSEIKRVNENKIKINNNEQKEVDNIEFKNNLDNKIFQQKYKDFRYYKSSIIINNVIKISKKPLIAIGSLAICYILISALIIFNIEGEIFDSFFNAIYCIFIVSLRTIGYRDFSPITIEGRIIVMISSVCSIIWMVLLSGVIGASYMYSLNEFNKNSQIKKKKRNINKLNKKKNMKKKKKIE